MVAVTQVHSNASLSRTYRLFRTMGLHHLFVGPAKPRVSGLVTRKVRRTVCSAGPMLVACLGVGKACSGMTLECVSGPQLLYDPGAEVLQDLTEENAQLVLGEKASHLRSAAPALPFIPYHPEELRRRGHAKRPGPHRRHAHAAGVCAGSAVGASMCACARCG